MKKNVPGTKLILLPRESESVSYHVQPSLQTTQGDLFDHISYSCLFVSLLENLLLDISWEHAGISEWCATETVSWPSKSCPVSCNAEHGSHPG